MDDPLLIRADASRHAGAGHVFRCLALAQAWQDRGGTAIFASAELPRPLQDRLEADRCRVEHVPAVPGSLEDAGFTGEMARRTGARWVVVDGYHLGSPYRRRLRESGSRVLLLDDDGSLGPYDVDAVLNQNLGAEAGLYAGATGGTRLLLGSHLAMLRREFRSPAGPRSRTREGVARLLVSFGGADPVDLSGRVLRALTESPVAGVSARLLVGPANPRGDALRLAAAPWRTQVEVVPAVADMAAQLDWADLALVGAGSTCWELCHRGVPALLVSLADNQRPLARAMMAAGAGLDLGWHADLTPSVLRDSIRGLAGRPESLDGMSRAGRRLVDGRGAARVAAYLHGAGRDPRGSLRISVVPGGPGSGSLAVALAGRLRARGAARLRESPEDVPWGEDLTFWVGGGQAGTPGLRERSRFNLWVQAHALRQGRRLPLSGAPLPHGCDAVELSLEEAVEAVGTGVVYGRSTVRQPGARLVGDMEECIVDLCEAFVGRYPESLVEGRAQTGG